MPRQVDHDVRRAELADGGHRGHRGCRRGRGTPARRGGPRRLHHRAAHPLLRRQARLLRFTFGHLARRTGERVAAAVEAGADPLDAVVEATLPLDAERRRTWLVWTAFWGHAVGDPDLVSDQRERGRAFVEQLAALLRADAGTCFRADLDPAAEGGVLAALITGIATQATFDPSGWPPERQRQAVELHVRSLAPAPEPAGRLP